MKKLFIFIFALIFVASAGLLAYGVIQGPKKNITIDEVKLDAPADGLFLGEYADQKIDMVALKNAGGVDANQKVAEMIINASYNNILINQFYYKAHADVKSTETTDEAFSDYFRAKNGANMFYYSLAYTGALNPITARVDYVDQRIESGGTADYDEETGWSYTFRPGKAQDKGAMTLPDLNPYNIYSWYDFPLDLGGVKRMSKKSTAGRSEDIDGSLIDAESVEIEELGSKDKYYSLTFSVIVADTNASEESIDRFADSCGQISDVTLKKLSFTVEIWKDAGVFRRICFDALCDASMSGRSGEVQINKTLEFSYSDKDASVAAHIKQFADDFDPKWITNFSAKNQEQLATELAKLPADNAEDKDAEEEE